MDKNLKSALKRENVSPLYKIAISQHQRCQKRAKIVSLTALFSYLLLFFFLLFDVLSSLPLFLSLSVLSPLLFALSLFLHEHLVISDFFLMRYLDFFPDVFYKKHFYKDLSLALTLIEPLMKRKALPRHLASMLAVAKDLRIKDFKGETFEKVLVPFLSKELDSSQKEIFFAFLEDVSVEDASIKDASIKDAGSLFDLLFLARNI